MATLAHADGAEIDRATRAAQADPRNATLQFALGVLLMNAGRDEPALAVFTRLTEEYPELPDPFNNIALLRARAGDLDGARGALESALRNDPGHRLAQANLGRVHLMLAVQAWDRLAARGPLDPALLRQLEGVRALLGMPTSPGR